MNGNAFAKSDVAVYCVERREAQLECEEMSHEKPWRKVIIQNGCQKGQEIVGGNLIAGEKHDQ